jgi:hypothetical protein
MKTSRQKRGCAEPRRHGKRPTSSEDGVDMTLIRWMLSLTPAERLKVLEDNAYSLMRLKHGTIEA